MSRATLSAVRKLLGDEAPLKKLSQNFLINPDIPRRIASAARIKPGEHVVEIGAGLGALTEALIEGGACVTLIEKDRRLRPILDPLNATKIYGDARDVNWQALAPDKIVANLPYHITTDLIELTLPHTNSLTVMVQREVAERLTDPACDRAISALIHATCTIEIAFHIPPECFYPAPHIESSVITINRHTPITPNLLPKLKQLYLHKRKMLRHSFPEELLIARNIDPTARLQHLTPQQIIQLI